MSYLKTSPPYGQAPCYGQNETNDRMPLSMFCLNFEEAKGVIDRQEAYITDLHKENNCLREELKKYTNRYVLTE